MSLGARTASYLTSVGLTTSHHGTSLGHQQQQHVRAFLAPGSLRRNHGANQNTAENPRASSETRRVMCCAEVLVWKTPFWDM